MSPGNTPTQRTGARRSDGALPEKAAPNGDPPEGAPVVPNIQHDDHSDEGAAADGQCQDEVDIQLKAQLQEQGAIAFATGDKVQGLWDTCEWLDATIVAHATTHNTYTIKWDVDKKVTSGYGTPDGRLRPHPAGKKANAPENGGGAGKVVRKRTTPPNAA